MTTAAPEKKDAKKKSLPDVTTKKETVYLECKLTEAEVRAASKTLADALSRKEGVESRIESFKTQAKADIAGIDAVIQKNTALVNSEKEFRNVACEVRFDWPKGLKETFRLDTGEAVFKSEISEDERQLQLVESREAK